MAAKKCVDRVPVHRHSIQRSDHYDTRPPCQHVRQRLEVWRERFRVHIVKPDQRPRSDGRSCYVEASEGGQGDGRVPEAAHRQQHRSLERLSSAAEEEGPISPILPIEEIGQIPSRVRFQTEPAHRSLPEASRGDRGMNWWLSSHRAGPSELSHQGIHLTMRGPSAVATASGDRKSTRLNSSHGYISYAVFCLKKK